MRVSTTGPHSTTYCTQWGGGDTVLMAIRNWVIENAGVENDEKRLDWAKAVVTCSFSSPASICSAVIQSCISVAPAEPRRKLNGDERGRHVTFRVAAAESHAISGAVTHSGHHSLSAHSTAVAAVGVSTDHHNPLLVVRCCPSQPRCVPRCALLIECVD